MLDDHSTTKPTAAALGGLGFDQAFRQFVVGDLAQHDPKLQISWAKGSIKVTADHLFSQLSAPPQRRTSWRLGESRPPPPPPLQLPAALLQAAEGIGNRWARLIAWLELGELVAEDVDGKAYPKSIWRRPDTVIDVSTGDLYVSGGKELLGRGLALRLAQPAIIAKRVKKSTPIGGPNSAERPTTSLSRNSRGPRARVGPKVREEMQRDLQKRSGADGRLTVETLGAMPEKELAARYNASRDTCRKAREAVLSGFARQIATNDN